VKEECDLLAQFVKSHSGVSVRTECAKNILIFPRLLVGRFERVKR
jgi:hypothetical protein